MTATAPQPCSDGGSFGFTQTTTIGAITRIGTVWLATMYGSRPRCASREWTRPTASANPTTAPIANPTTASLPVKSALCTSTDPSEGWFTCAGSANAFAIVQMCGIDVRSTTNGHVQPADDQIRR